MLPLELPELEEADPEEPPLDEADPEEPPLEESPLDEVPPSVPGPAEPDVHAPNATKTSTIDQVRGTRRSNFMPKA